MADYVGNPDVNRLSTGQKDCLRLVLAHKTSKEIARELEISSHTVDQRIRYAIRALGARSRMQAAMYLAEAEKGGSSAFSITNFDMDSLIDLRSDVAKPARPLMYQSTALSYTAGSDAALKRRDGSDLFEEARYAQDVLEKNLQSKDRLDSIRNNSLQTGLSEQESIQTPEKRVGLSEMLTENKLRWSHRIIAVLLIASFSLIAAGNLIVGFEALSNILRYYLSEN